MTLSLSDLTAKPVKVNVRTNYGRALEVTLALPSYHRSREIMESVPAPVAPMRVTADRSKTVPDLESASYKAALQERATEQNYRILVDALTRGGLEIDGADLAAKTAAFRASDPDAGICNALIAFISEAVAGVQRTADDRPFRSVPPANDASVPLVGNDAGDVAITTGQ